MKSDNYLHSTALSQIRLLGFLAGLALVFAIISSFLHGSSLIRDWENRFQSHYYLLRSYFSEPEATELPLVIVLIDDHSLPKGTSRSPIDRLWLSKLIDGISEQDPALLAVNILLDRAGDELSDQILKSSLEKAGNVILRDDPFYPVLPVFSKAALDRGSVRFRLDSTDTVQDVCAHALSCQSNDIFYKKIIERYDAAAGGDSQRAVPEVPWLKINFSLTSQSDHAKRVKRFVVLRAHEVFQLPESALKNKLVLVGTGFPDLYPLYRVPLPGVELMLQETEVIAQVLSMIANQTYLTSLSAIWTGLLIFLLLLVLTLVMVHRGALLTVLISTCFLVALFVAAAWAFAFHNIEIAYVLPASVLILFSSIALLICSVQERFFRIGTELKLKQSKIDFLTNELHSHHLFNEFSRLSVMIQHDPQAAKEYLIEFAEMLRSSLKYGDQPGVPVPVQVDYLKSYLAQQRLISNGRLQFDLSVAETLESVKIPWHTFYPLVENAVKYAEAHLKAAADERVTITITLEAAAGFMIFKVSNPFTSEQEVPSSKTGIRNLKERLSWAYPQGGYHLEFRHDSHLWIAELKLPITDATG